MASDAAPLPDTYRTLLATASVEVKVKGSRFIAEAFPATSASEALAHVDVVSRREHAATHHCWAYRLGVDGHAFRFNDDGEPAGTAGAPILRQIEGRGLVDAIVVVTRYFGGTKLGTGGLIRAYGDAAALVLDGAPQVERIIREPIEVRFSYDDTSAAMQTLSRFDATVAGSSYGSDTRLNLLVRRSQSADFEAAFIENLAGRGVISRPST